MKPNYQSNIILIDEIEKKNQLKERERENESIRLTRQICDSGHKTGTTQ